MVARKKLSPVVKVVRNAGLHQLHPAAGAGPVQLAPGEEDPRHADGGALCRHRQPRQAPALQPAVGGQGAAGVLRPGTLPHPSALN